jgi:hypothetical protein
MSIVTVPPDKIFIQSGAQIQELVKLTKELMSEAYLFTRKQIKKKKNGGRINCSEFSQLTNPTPFIPNHELQKAKNRQRCPNPVVTTRNQAYDTAFEKPIKNPSSINNTPKN